MKNKILLSILLILSISIILISCDDPNSPAVIARKVYKAAEDDDFDTFVNYSTFKPSVNKYYAFVLFQQLPRSEGKIKSINDNVIVSPEVIKEISDYLSIEIDTIVDVNLEYGKKKYSFYFTKIDGIWKFSGFSLANLSMW